MPPTVERLNEPTPAQLNQGQQKADTIVYRVAGLEFSVLKALVLGGTGLPGVPSIGTAHPDFPALKCRALRVGPIPNGPGTISRVFADFTTSNFPGAGLLHAAPDVSGGQFIIEGTYQDVEIEVPAARLHTYTANVGGQEASATAWVVEPYVITETRLILKARWGIEGRLVTVGDMRLLSRESNHVHTIAGEKYLFRAGRVVAKDNLTYEVHATWEVDEGTPEQFSRNTDQYLLPNSQDMPYWQNPDEGLMRNPYHRLHATPAVFPDAPPSDPFSIPVLDQIPWPDGDYGNLIAMGAPNL